MYAVSESGTVAEPVFCNLRRLLLRGQPSREMSEEETLAMEARPEMMGAGLHGSEALCEIWK